MSITQMHVFYRDKDGAIQHVFEKDGLHLNDNWTDKAGAPAAHGDPAAMATPEEQHVFYRDEKHAIRHIWWSASGGFKHDVWPAADGKPPVGDPAAIATYRQQHVFYRDLDGAIRHMLWSWKRGFAHDNWTVGALEAGYKPPAAAGDPAAMRIGLGEINTQHVFYRDEKRAIQHIWWSERGRFKHNNWTEGALKAGHKPPAAFGDPAALSQHVFYRDENGAIHHIWWSEGWLRLRRQVDRLETSERRPGRDCHVMVII